jgi:hypothetical protein
MANRKRDANERELLEQKTRACRAYGECDEQCGSEGEVLSVDGEGEAPKRKGH